MALEENIQLPGNSSDCHYHALYKLNSIVKLNYSLLILISCIPLLQACSIDQSEVRSFVQESVNECNGTVKDVILTREGPFTGKYSGFATVTISGIDYTPELTAVSDSGSYIVKLGQNVCAVHELQEMSEKLQRDLDNLNF